MSFVSCSVKEKSWLLEKSPILTINHCHSRLEEVINPLFLIPFSISHCVQDAPQMFHKRVLQRYSNLAAIEWKEVRKLGMTVNNVCTGPQERRQFFIRLKFELNGPLDEFVQTGKLIWIYFQLRNRMWQIIIEFNTIGFFPWRGWGSIYLCLSSLPSYKFSQCL